MSVPCPCCNRPMDAAYAPIESLSEGRLEPQMRAIVSALSKAYPRPVSHSALFDILYGDDPNGGPENPRNVVAVRIWKVRKQIEKYGWTIPHNNGGIGSNGRYRLAPIGAA